MQPPGGIFGILMNAAPYKIYYLNNNDQFSGNKSQSSNLRIKDWGESLCARGKG